MLTKQKIFISSKPRLHRLFAFVVAAICLLFPYVAMAQTQFAMDDADNDRGPEPYVRPGPKFLDFPAHGPAIATRAVKTSGKP